MLKKRLLFAEIDSTSLLVEWRLECNRYLVSLIDMLCTLILPVNRAISACIALADSSMAAGCVEFRVNSSGYH